MAMKAYESYKNTEYDWLPRIPAHWIRHSVRKITSVSSERNENTFSRNDLLSVYREYGVIKKFSRDDNHNVESLDLSKYKTVHKNYLVINKMKMWQGSLGISKYDGIVSPAYIVCKLNLANVNYQFIHALLRAATFKTFYNRISYGVRVGQWDASYEDLKSLNLYLPPKEEQDQIVRYLDWQNSRLNKLINAKKREIALLEEQKQALISQAVTKGLDPHAPLKDSGIDWIGQIPEHWLLCNLKYLCSMKSGKNLTSIQITENGPYPVYGGNGVRGYYSQYNVSGECLIIGRQGALCGNVHYVHEKIWATDHAVVTQVSNFIHLKFFYYLLTAMNLNRYASQTAAQPGLAVSNILNQKVCFPPINEQLKIAVYLEHQCIFIDNLINNINKTISLLQEYRTRLVADVVTGQIDVRHIAIPNYEAITETIGQPEADEDSTICTEDQ